MNADECGVLSLFFLSHTHAHKAIASLLAHAVLQFFSRLPFITCFVANILMMAGDHHQLENDFTDNH